MDILIFLVNTRPDIQFVVHQCARFTHNPKMLHQDTIKRILRYLKKTQKNGKNRELMFDTQREEILSVECYVNTDFTGLWNMENNADPVNSKSRTGFVIFINNCPVIWQSKLQRETALSTIESEIIVMSIAIRELL